MDDNEKLRQAIETHTKGLDQKELEMVLRFVYSLEEFRQK
jgi:hypothetical protein